MGRASPPVAIAPAEHWCRREPSYATERRRGYMIRGRDTHARRGVTRRCTQVRCAGVWLAVQVHNTGVANNVRSRPHRTRC